MLGRANPPSPRSNRTTLRDQRRRRWKPFLAAQSARTWPVLAVMNQRRHEGSRRSEASQVRDGLLWTLSPSLRGRPFIEAADRQPIHVKRAQVAVPSGTALHRGLATAMESLEWVESPSLRGRPFIEAWRRCTNPESVW